MTAVLERPTRIEPGDDEPEQLVGAHTEYPVADGGYRNGLVHGPARTPWTWKNETEETITLAWLSLWEDGQCVAVAPIHPVAHCAPGDGFTASNTTHGKTLPALPF